MTELTLYHNPRCSKSRGALELLEARGLTPEVVRYLETPPDAATLKATVDTYNGYCAAGVDEQFGKDAALLDKVDAGPYYAVTGVSYCYSTCGGLDINADFQVLAADGVTPINGLYAVGTDSMGVLFTETKPYVTYGGAAQGWAYTSGYLAGESVAEKLGK